MGVLRRYNGTDWVDVSTGTNPAVREVNAQTANYTLVLADAGKVIEVNSAAARTVTVPPAAAAAFAVGTVIDVSQVGAGAVTVAAGVGVTLIGAVLSTVGIGQALYLRKQAANTWLVSVAAALPATSGGSGGGLSVRDYGATGNGVTDDTAAFNAARTAAGLNGSIVAPKGTYNLPNGFDLNVAGQKLTLDAGAILKRANGTTTNAAILRVSAARVVVSGPGAIDGNRTNLGVGGDGFGIHVTANDCMVIGVEIHNLKNYGIAAENAQRFKARTNRIYNTTQCPIFVVANGPATNGTQDVFDTEIFGNEIDRSAMAAADINDANIKLYSTATGDGPTGAVVRATRILNNICRLPPNMANPSICIEAYGAPETLITGNYMRGGFMGISLGSAAGSTVSGNIVTGAVTFAGIEVASSPRSVITGNVIDVFDSAGVASAPSGGIVVDGAATTPGPVSMVSITGNNVRGAKIGINVTSGKSHTISGGVVEFQHGGGAGAGILVDGGATVSDVTIGPITIIGDGLQNASRGVILSRSRIRLVGVTFENVTKDITFSPAANYALTDVSVTACTWSIPAGRRVQAGFLQTGASVTDVRYLANSDQTAGDTDLVLLKAFNGLGGYIAADSFTRANAATLATSTTGHAWTAISGGMKVLDGRAHATTGTAAAPLENSAVLNAGIADVRVRCNIGIDTTFLIARNDGVNRTWVAAVAEASYKIRRINVGVGTTLLDTGVLSAVGDVMELVCVGTAYTLIVNGVTAGTVAADAGGASIASNTFVGVGADKTTASVDNFTVRASS